MAEARRTPSERERAASQASAYDRMSRWYPFLADPFERRYRMAGLKMLDLREGSHVLVVGAGTGEGLLRAAQECGPSGFAVGVDISSAMARLSHRRLACAGVSLWSAVVRADALRLPFCSASFQAAFMSFTLELFSTEDIPVVLSECRRVLRPGGPLGVVAMAETGQGGLMLRLYRWAHRTWPASVDCRPIPVAQYLAEAGFVVRNAMEMTLTRLPVVAVVADAPDQP